MVVPPFLQTLIILYHFVDTLDIRSRVMLTSVFRVLINNLVKESFYGKRKRKKTINVLIVFFISHKSDVKIFQKWIVNQYPKDTR